MYERFTDGARRVMECAHLAAKSRGAACVGTEHILLALSHGDAESAAHILRSLGIRFTDVRSLLPKPFGEDIIVGAVPLSFRVEHMITVAADEANKVKQDISTEHMLLAATYDGRVAEMLNRLGVEPIDVRNALECVASTEPDDTLSVGDVVELRSGGPAMTVGKTATDSSGEPYALCGWFDADMELCHAEFPAASLTICQTGKK